MHVTLRVFIKEEKISFFECTTNTLKMVLLMMAFNMLSKRKTSESKQRSKQKKKFKHLFRCYIVLCSSVYGVSIHTLVQCMLILLFFESFCIAQLALYVYRILHVLSLTLIRIHYNNMPILHIRCMFSVRYAYTSFIHPYMYVYGEWVCIHIMWEKRTLCNSQKSSDVVRDKNIYV